MLLDIPDPVLYGSRFWARFLGQNSYTGPKRGNMENFAPIQGSVYKNDKHFITKRSLQCHALDIG